MQGTISFSSVVLAAGMSTRMQGCNKLLLPAAGEPVIRRTVRAVLEARPRETIVVTGFQRREVGDALAGLPVRLQANPRFEQGQAASVAAGVAALAHAVDAVMICLGDMALLEAVDYRELIDAFAGIGDKSILLPQFDGQRGNPVLFASWLAPQVIGGECNPGCRRLIAERPQDVFVYQAAHDRFVIDLDNPQDYQCLLGRLARLPRMAAGSTVALTP
jgi:molybdenum cofactor cytidylyltransferase